MTKVKGNDNEFSFLTTPMEYYKPLKPVNKIVYSKCKTK